MTDIPDVKLKALVNFPADVRSGAGVAITKNNGIYTIAIDSAVIDLDEVIYTAPATGAADRSVTSKLSDIVNAADFGAIGNGIANDTSAIQSGLTYLGNIGGGELWLPKRYAVLGNLTVPSGVKLIGSMRAPTFNRGGGIFDLTAQASVIFLGSAFTITVRGNGAVEGLTIVRNGLVIGEDPTTAFAGTAIDVRGDDVYLGDLMIAGFNRAVLATSITDGERAARYTMVRIIFDCINGLSVDNIHDIGRMIACHGINMIGSTSSLRSGVAFEIGNACDWMQLIDCFCYGFNKGYNILGQDTQLIGCGADYDPTVSAGSNTANGFRITGGALRTKMIGCQAAAQLFGVLDDSTDGSSVINGCTFWSQDDFAINLVNGGTVTDNIIRTTAKGIRVQTTATNSIIVGNKIMNTTGDALSIEGAAIATAIRHSNTFVGCASITTPNSFLGSQNLGLGVVAGIQGVNANRRYFSLSGTSDRSIIEIATGGADADAAVVGSVDGCDQLASGEKRVTSVSTALDGATANNRGGRLKFATKINNGNLTSRGYVDQAGNWVFSEAALTTTATDGFTYIATCPGIPTGVPTSKTGAAPLVVDSTNSKLYAYIGGAWRIMN